MASELRSELIIVSNFGTKPTFGYIIDFNKELISTQTFLETERALLFPGAYRICSESVKSRIVVIERETKNSHTHLSSIDSSIGDSSSGHSTSSSSGGSNTPSLSDAASSYNAEGSARTYAALIDAIGSTYQLSPFFFQDQGSVREDEYVRVGQGEDEDEDEIFLSYPDGAFEVPENPLLETCSPPTTLKLHFQGDLKRAPHLTIIVKLKDGILTCDIGKHVLNVRSANKLIDSSLGNSCRPSKLTQPSAKRPQPPYRRTSN